MTSENKEKLRETEKTVSEEKKEKKKKVDARQMIIYSAILKPKFDE